MAHPDEREFTSYEQSMPDEDLDYDQSPIISNEREFPSAEEQDTDHDAEPIRFHCEFPNCGRSYALRYTLLRHLKTHGQERIRFYCEFPDCGQSYGSKSALSQHVQTIHNPEPIRF